MMINTGITTTHFKLEKGTHQGDQIIAYYSFSVRSFFICSDNIKSKHW